MPNLPPIVVYDIETYPNSFTCAMSTPDRTWQATYEISEWRDDRIMFVDTLTHMKKTGHHMVGFNNERFDYPVIHGIVHDELKTAADIYARAMEIINADFNDWSHVVWSNAQYVPQIDLYRVHHFDNAAKRTSLKILEFNLRMPHVRTLPFEVGTMLTFEQNEQLKAYNWDDVNATILLLEKTIPMLEFRKSLTDRMPGALNYNDTKIGKDYLSRTLESQGVTIWEYESGKGGKRKPKQTIRKQIELGQIILPYIKFLNTPLIIVLETMKGHVVTNTRKDSVIDSLQCEVRGFPLHFGLGGIHGSIKNTIVRSSDYRAIIDIDVASFYPSMAIVNGWHPEHLGAKFAEVYADIKQQRFQHAKGTPENAMLKLALNGVYGDSNNKYSVFYDPQFTMQITVNGQLLLAMLIEWVLSIDHLKMIQANTDGITVSVYRRDIERLRFICSMWESLTSLELEYAEYETMAVRDVNNYLAVYQGGEKTKRKGAYEYDLELHQNHNALVVPKVTEKILKNPKQKITDLLRNWDNPYDFFLRTKVQKNHKVVTVDADGVLEEQQSVNRYYVAKSGVSMFKVMPPLKEGGEERMNNMVAGHHVQINNDCVVPTGAPIDYAWYQEQVERLVNNLSEEQQ
jgi:hypothetical protein